MKWRCVIFDLDGTLVDSERLNSQAYTELVDEISEEPGVLANRYRGMKYANIVSDIESRYQVVLGKDFESRYRARVKQLYEAHLAANPGVENLLQRIKVPKCVASSAPKQKITHALSVAGLDHHFEGAIFSAYEVNAWKPEPDLFIHAASAMRVPCEACAVVEDSHLGVEAGLAAGMQVFHYQPAIERVEKGGVVSFGHMDQLAPYLCRDQVATP